MTPIGDPDCCWAAQDGPPGGCALLGTPSQLQAPASKEADVLAFKTSSTCKDRCSRSHTPALSHTQGYANKPLRTHGHVQAHTPVPVCRGHTYRTSCKLANADVRTKQVQRHSAKATHRSRSAHAPDRVHAHWSTTCPRLHTAVYANTPLPPSLPQMSARGSMA